MRNLALPGLRLSRNEMKTIKGGKMTSRDCLGINRCISEANCNGFCNENGCGVGTCHVVNQVNRCICGAP
ncbi:hypothetical protein KTO58_08120 [Chitinophaga pendula]|uniref:hypothetical protein n=1 Tax=Chitinophaga TaxID=79328 RepID=UPI0012FE67DE|nr:MULTISPECIES: hypothetical protein [Chitinophaga]UCJ09137.1 hypothetical protein KTO58_08120 [Chitinophaga pendula]